MCLGPRKRDSDPDPAASAVPNPNRVLCPSRSNGASSSGADFARAMGDTTIPR